VTPPAAAARFLKPLGAEAKRQGAPLYVVGGPVRDWLLKRATFDLDLTVAGDPDPVADLAARLVGGRVVPFGAFGTRRIVGRGKFRVDVAVTRAEAYAEPAALPALTETGVPIEQDLLRRDFTINAMAARIDDGSYALVDPFDGARDMKAKTLRVLHGGSFRDDPTRVFRAARFLGRLGYHPDAELLRQAQTALESGAAQRLSPHRLLHELVCLLGEKDPFPALHLLGEWGYLPFLLVGPALKAGLDAKRLPGGVEERLLWLTLALGRDEGRVFADFFPFDRETRRRLHDALALALSDASPRAALDPLVRGARRAHAVLPDRRRSGRARPQARPRVSPDPERGRAPTAARRAQVPRRGAGLAREALTPWFSRIFRRTTSNWSRRSCPIRA
jgi:tRNA nucleotidyltransferase/poly(A) polymerase